MVSYIKILEELVDSKRTSFYTENFHAIDLAIKKLLKRLKDLKCIEQKHKKINGQLREKVKELEDKNRVIKNESDAYAQRMINLDNELQCEKEHSKYEWIRQNCLPQGLVNKLYIPKSKIKEILIDKIEYRKFELQQEYKDFKDDGILNILQDIKEELLEE